MTESIDAGALRVNDIATAPITRMTVTAPGVFDIPAEDYHRDPVPGGSLSASGVKLIIDCPQRFRYRQQHPEFSAAMDFGSAAHHRVLGVGEEVVVVDAPDWRTKSAREARDEARAAGKSAILAKDDEIVQGMADALREHRVASQLFVPGKGVAERAHVWFDAEFGIWRRSLTDWKLYLPDGRVVVCDYKTTKRASPWSIAKSVWDFGYHIQDAFYRDGVEILDDTDRVEFLFVFQEKEPPYITTVVELTEEAVQWGRLQVRKAMEVYARCLAEDYWPGYSDAIERIELPRYAQFELESAWQRPADTAGSLQVLEEI